MRFDKRPLTPIALISLICTVLVTTGCFGPRFVRADPSTRIPLRTFNGPTEHVILISIDGLRPDAIGQFQAATLNRLMVEGSSTLAATTILPSKTLPSHTSMLTGQPPDVHGVSWNNKLSPKQKELHVPTVFAVLRSQGFVTAAFFSKPKFSTLQRPGSLDYSKAPGGWWGHWPADRMVRDVEQYLSAERPNLLFVHLSDADRAGHDFGWMSPRYGEAVQRIDTSIAGILTVAAQTFGAGNFTVIVTADHGGHDRDHGSEDPRDTTIPWIAWGRAVKPGLLGANLKTMDTAATILWLFRVPEPTDWLGDPVTAAF